MRSKVIFIFLDGIGIGRAGNENPVYRFGLFSRWLRFPLVEGVARQAEGILAKGIDARLGTGGIPQSATGQTALFTGINAAKLLGCHLPAFPGAKLRERISENNLFGKVLGAGRSAAFANAYRPEYFDNSRMGKSLPDSVTTCSCNSSGVELRGVESYRNGKALFWDITGRYAAKRTSSKIDEISPERAGEIVCGLSAEFDLVVFESFLTDLIGHSRKMGEAEEFCRVLDRFTGAVVGGKPRETTLVITSDHGNFEDLSTRTHTLNPVPLLACGPAASRFSGAECITDVPGIIFSAVEGRV